MNLNLSPSSESARRAEGSAAPTASGPARGNLNGRPGSSTAGPWLAAGRASELRLKDLTWKLENWKLLSLRESAGAGAAASRLSLPVPGQSVTEMRPRLAGPGEQ